MNDCIFCKILNGDLPSARVYEDDAAVAFLDIFPFTKGHTLVVPREHVGMLPEMAPEHLARLITVVQNIARRVMKAVECDGFNLLQNNGPCAGQTVSHVHFHIVPRFNGTPVQWTPNANLYAPGEMDAIARKIRAS